MPTAIFGRLTEAERRNGWTEETLRQYLAERQEAHGLVGGFVPTAMRRADPPLRVETTRGFSPHKWGMR